MMYSSSRFFVLAIACVVGLGAIAFFRYESEIEKNQRASVIALEEALNEAERLLTHAHPIRALEILNATKAESDPKWRKLYLNTALALEDDAMLFKLWLLEPDLFQDQEKLSLQAATYALSIHDLDHYHQIAKPWHNLGKEGQSWLLLEADALILNGELEQAIAFLHAASLQGNQEILRLIRLALLNENEHPKVAWDYLLKALKINPNDPDLHLYRAELLESAKNKDLATLEYQKASTKGAGNPLYTEELANFFIRAHQYKEALSLLQASPLTSDPLRLKTLFLNRVYLGNETEFWDPSLERLAGPEAEWLKVLQDLKWGEQKKAFDTLKNHPEMADLNPALYEGLKKAIARQNPYLKEESVVIIPDHSHPIFALMSEDELPKEYAALMDSKDGFAALALASGWFEAALNLRQTTGAFPEEYPRWVAYGFAKALLSNRSKEAAFSFIQKQTPTPQLYLLAGELALQMGRNVEAEKILAPLAKKHSETGVKAALLLSQAYAANQNFLKARNAILDNATLAASTSGKETLARLELAFGDPTLAEKMYRELGNDSIEAKSFFAKKAYEDKDYQTAYRLTKHLVDQFPERKDLKVQLNKIKYASESKNQFLALPAS